MTVLRRASVRVRLTLWYAAAVTILLILFAAGTFVLLRQGLYREIDRQLDSDYRVADEIVESAVRAGTLVPHHDTLAPEQPGNWRWLEIWGTDRRLLYANPEDLSLDLPHVAEAPPAGNFGPASVTLNDGRRARVLSRPFTFLGFTAVIRVIRSEEGMAYEQRYFLYGLLVLLPVGLAGAGLGGYALARRALAPVADMAARVRTITADRLAERLEITNPDDEFGQLAAVFNDTLARIEAAFDQLRRFTADVSHELRTPLTAIRSVGEIGLRDRRTDAEYREIIGSVLEEAFRLSRLVDSLLTISRGDAQLTALNVEVFDCSLLARDVVDCLGVLAEEKHQPITLDAPAAARALADKALLRHAVMNILDNAIKYSYAHTAIRVAVRDARDVVSIEIADQGVGIAPEHLSRIFDRFYRVDKARQTAGGAGLGLAIARWAVEANNGRIEVSSEVARGSVFRIIVPRAPSAAAAAPAPTTGRGESSHADALVPGTLRTLTDKRAT